MTAGNPPSSVASSLRAGKPAYPAELRGRVQTMNCSSFRRGAIRGYQGGLGALRAGASDQKKIAHKFPARADDPHQPGRQPRTHLGDSSLLTRVALSGRIRPQKTAKKLLMVAENRSKCVPVAWLYRPQEGFAMHELFPVVGLLVVIVGAIAYVLIRTPNPR